MNKFLRVTAQTSLITLISFSISYGQDWELVYSGTPGEPGVIKQICFIPHNNWMTGWALYTDFTGLLIKTTDGGAGKI